MEERILKIACNQNITKSPEPDVQELQSRASEYSGGKNVSELVLKCFVSLQFSYCHG